MTLDGIREAATKQQSLLPGYDGPISVTFILPGRWGKGTKLLAGKGSPRGECVSELEGSVVCMFDAAEVVAWCDKMTAATTPLWIAMSDRHPTDADRANGWVWAWVPGFGLDQIGGIVSTATHWLPGTLPEPTCGPAKEAT